MISSSYRIYSGCNVENSSFGLTICAERTAIVKVYDTETHWTFQTEYGKFLGDKRRRSRISCCHGCNRQGQLHLAVWYACFNNIEMFAKAFYPGACRQFLSEFGNIPIISMKNDGSLQMQMLSHLLPFHFSKNDFVQ